MGRLQGFDFRHCNLIVAENADVEAAIELPKPLHQVVGERVVIVYYDNAHSDDPFDTVQEDKSVSPKGSIGVAGIMRSIGAWCRVVSKLVC
jgi:hypothetical protein